MFNHISSQAIKLVELTRPKKINSKTKIIAITSGKGGVGKSTLTVNFSSLFGSKGFKIAVLDADIGMANLQVHFNIKPEFTIYDYINSKVQLNKIIHKIDNNIDLIAGKSGYEATEHRFVSYNKIVDELLALNYYDYIVIDTSAGVNNHVKEFLQIADEIIAITTTDPSALTDVYAMIKMVSKFKQKIWICFNHTKKYETGRAICNSLQSLGMKNKIDSKFMIEYLGNVEQSNSIATTGRLRKIYTSEFGNELASVQIEQVVDAFLINTRS
ncbi:MAG: AAA family ATPase [Campylobacterales bacterium]|nr:AAA family ATPase [Campylobacterales bacterium]